MDKLWALEMLDITVWFNGEEVEISGKTDSSIVTIHS